MFFKKLKSSIKCRHFENNQTNPLRISQGVSCNISVKRDSFFCKEYSKFQSAIEEANLNLETIRNGKNGENAPQK